jgi:tetratricopeptide (TPR) repeat protein
LKGDILIVRQDYVGAVAEYRAVLYEEPQNFTVALSLARAHFLNNELLLSEQVYKKILEENPKAKEARFALVDIYRRKGKINLATEQLEKVLEQDPYDTKALSILDGIARVKTP